MILVKIHRSINSQVLCLCDSDLIGKRLRQGNKQLEITERFYKGEETPKTALLSLIKISNNINIIGKESIEFAVRNKLIDKSSIIKIQGIPHAQIFRL